MSTRFHLPGHTDNISLQNSANFSDAMFTETRTVEYPHKEWIEIQAVSIELSIECATRSPFLKLQFVAPLLKQQINKSSNWLCVPCFIPKSGLLPFN